MTDKKALPTDACGEGPYSLQRRRPDSNRGSRICSPLPYQLGYGAVFCVQRTRGAPHRVPDVSPPLSRAGNRTRTGDPNLGKVVLYQLSYSRMGQEAINPYPPQGRAVPTFPPRMQ